MYPNQFEDVQMLMTFNYLEFQVLKNYSSGRLSVQDAHEVLSSSLELLTNTDSFLESSFLGSILENKEAIVVVRF